MVDGYWLNPLWRLITWLPGIVLRMIFTPSRMASLVKLEIARHGEQVVFTWGDVANVSVRLEVLNRSPLHIELDRASLSLWRGGVQPVSTIWFLDRVAVGAGEEREISAFGCHSIRNESLLPGGTEPLSCGVDVRAYFNSRVGKFSVTSGNLSARARVDRVCT